MGAIVEYLSVDFAICVNISNNYRFLKDFCK